MKKHLIILAAAFVALFCVNSCSSKDDTTPETPQEPTYLEALTGEWKVTSWYGNRYEESAPYPDGEGTFFSYDYDSDDVYTWTITADKTITEYQIIGDTEHELSFTLNFEEIDDTVLYEETIWGQFDTILDAGLEVVSNNEIIITTITNLYFSNYRCTRIR